MLAKPTEEGGLTPEEVQGVVLPLVKHLADKVYRPLSCFASSCVIRLLQTTNAFAPP